MHLSLDGRCIFPGETMFTAEEVFPVHDVMGIEKGLLLPGTDDSMFSSEEACALAQKYPDRIAWLCNMIPDGTDRTYETIRRYKDMGARGVGEFTHNLRLDDPVIEHLLGCCQELDMPFLFHMSPKENAYYGIVDFAGLPLLEGVLKKFPGLKVVGHSQPFWFEMDSHRPDITPEERNIYPAGPVREGRLPELFRKYPNLYGDLSADSGGNALMRDPDYAVAFMNEFQDRLMFGTDMVNANLIYPLGFWLDSLLHQGKLDQQVYGKICRGNAEKVYKL